TLVERVLKDDPEADRIAFAKRREEGARFERDGGNIICLAIAADPIAPGEMEARRVAIDVAHALERDLAMAREEAAHARVAAAEARVTAAEARAQVELASAAGVSQFGESSFVAHVGEAAYGAVVDAVAAALAAVARAEAALARGERASARADAVMERVEAGAAVMREAAAGVFQFTQDFAAATAPSVADLALRAAESNTLGHAAAAVSTPDRHSERRAADH
ncbi:hypothetical protein BDK51DRAFT_53104, partial [Blyttiomyces helicus]